MMFVLKPSCVIAFCLVFTFAANAGTPVNGLTSFNSVTPGVKASGNAGAASGITAANIEGFNFKLNTAASGPVMLIEVWDGFVGTGNGVAFYESTSSINPLFSGITITANDESKFDLTSIGINAQNTAGGNTTVTLTGLNAAGNPVSGATTTGVASVSSLTLFNVSANAAFKNIYGIRITSTDIVYAFIDNITIANLTVLPVQWLEFTAIPQNNNILLKWGTAFEQGTTSFIIQHSATGTNWTDAGTIPAAGNSTTDKLYSFVHTSPSRGANYYRLIQQDIDGRQDYSKILYLNLDDRSTHFSVYPNVAANRLLNIKLDKAANIQILNSAGSLVILKAYPAGVQQVDLAQLPPGVYRIRARNETISFIIP
ncbi:MAG: T9SS type A sorting domain-containing protein [Rhizobacter sp.]|nr:T9SS type A sorting domain-containing protein [Ferruginibacter sp.]